MPSSSRKVKLPQASTTLPKLTLPRLEAYQKLEAHIQKGREIAQRVISSQVVIELKMTRSGLKAKEVSDQLIIDTDRYRAHPDCKMLIALVYNPQEYLTNTRGIEHDLTKTINGVSVNVIISPH